MLADDAACDPRNALAARVINNADARLDLYGQQVEVDYRGYDVTVENFIRVLTNRLDDHIVRSKRLLSDENSRIFVYMTGHGGDEFLKFQDKEELTAQDLSDAFSQMWEKKR
jgi:phosphatidylinositol glycan class K